MRNSNSGSRMLRQARKFRASYRSMASLIKAALPEGSWSQRPISSDNFRLVMMSATLMTSTIGSTCFRSDKGFERTDFESKVALTTAGLMVRMRTMTAAVSSGKISGWDANPCHTRFRRFRPLGVPSRT